MTGGTWTWLLWGAVALAVLLAVGWLLSYTAVWLDRLHHRMQATAAALDAQLVRRAEATLELALTGDLDPATSTLLAGAASEALAMPGPWSPDRARTESGLTEVLRAVDPALAVIGQDGVPGVPGVPGAALDATAGGAEHGEALGSDGAQEALARLRAAAVRVRYARRFHNEAVEDVLRLRRRPDVRWLRLAGRSREPQPVTFDDGWPVDAVD